MLQGYAARWEATFGARPEDLVNAQVELASALGLEASSRKF
jgi:hypothetical protein